MRKHYFLTTLSLLFCFAMKAQTFQTWRNDSGTGDNSWQNTVNWWNFPDASPIVFGQQEWDNNHLPAQVNSADLSTWRFLYKLGATDAHTFSGNQISFFDFSGQDPQIINQSTGTHTINNNINGDPDAADPLTFVIDNTGGLILGGTINNQGWIDVNGATGTATSVIFNGIISGTGGITKENTNITLNLNADNTYSGATNVNNGTLVLEGSLANSAVSVGANGTLQISENATLSSLTVAAGGIVIVDAGTSLNITNNFSNSGTLTANHGSSIKVSGTSTGGITYNLSINDTNWHLLSSPVEGEGYDTSWVDANLIDNTTRTVGTNVGISTYDNTTGNWIYATDGSTGNFDTGKGYSIKRDATTSDISFTGTIKVNDASISITANDIGSASENRWTLIGNPFTNYVNVTDLLALTANGVALEDSREALYVWNGTTYAPITTGFIYPGQGFFVNSDVASTNIAINQNMLSHQTGVTFYKNANTSINLIISDGSKIKSTEINYLDGKTTGLDPRFDLGSFNGVSSSFNIFSQLLSDNNGVEFARQALPTTDLESMVIPVGIIADAGEITFSAEAMNLPDGLKVFLEDRTTNTFTRLDEANASYKVTLAEKTDAIGRFYLHTKSNALSTNDVTLEYISIYPTNKATLRIVGLSQGKSTIKLFNILGKQVVNTSFTSNGVYDVNLPKLATGLYIVQLDNETGTLNKKIILE
jgi:autotransporter-associated beta strand protein